MAQLEAWWSPDSSCSGGWHQVSGTAVPKASRTQGPALLPALLARTHPWHHPHPKALLVWLDQGQELGTGSQAPAFPAWLLKGQQSTLQM